MGCGGAALKRLPVWIDPVGQRLALGMEARGIRDHPAPRVVLAVIRPELGAGIGARRPWSVVGFGGGNRETPSVWLGWVGCPGRRQSAFHANYC